MRYVCIFREQRIYCGPHPQDFITILDEEEDFRTFPAEVPAGSPSGDPGPQKAIGPDKVLPRRLKRSLLARIRRRKAYKDRLRARTTGPEPKSLSPPSPIAPPTRSRHEEYLPYLI